MGPFYVMTFGKATNSLGKAWWPDNTGMCKTFGNAWARAPKVSVTHPEDFYFFMDCTGHEIIISSAPYHKPRRVETALCSMQARLWTLPLVQDHGPLLGHDFRKSNKLARSNSWGPAPKPHAKQLLHVGVRPRRLGRHGWP